MNDNSNVFLEKSNINNDSYPKPQLRFKEFNEPWAIIKLGDILEFIPTNSYSRAKLNLDEGEIKNIHYGDIHTKFPTLVDCSIEKIPYLNSEVNVSKFKKEQYCKNGDLIIADASENYEDIGKAIELINVESKVVSGLHTILARDKNNKTALGFKGYLFLNESLRKDIKMITNGISVLGVSKNNIAKLNVNLPPYEEQEMIVKFLSLIDKKITLMQKTLSLYQKHKIYSLNTLTTYDKKIHSNWTKYEFKDFLEEISEKSTINNQYEVLSSTKEGINLQRDYFNRDIASKDNTGYKILRKNQLVLSPQNLWLGNINVNEDFEIGLVSPSYKIYNLNNKVEIDYFKHLIKTPRMLYQYETVSEQGASVVRRNLNNKLLEKIEIYMPYLDKQKEIGDFLCLLDSKINLISDNIFKMKEFKKGLLQKMFV